MRAITLALMATLLAPCPARPQALILDLISSRGEPLEASSDIRLERFADFETVPQVEIGMQLDDGDLLASVSGRTALELECPPDSNSTFKLSGPFRIIVTSPVEGACRLDLLVGTLDVLTDEQTEVNSGGAVLGTEGTQYALSVYRRDGAAVRDLQVFDGIVAVTGIEQPQRVHRKETLLLSPVYAEPVKGAADERALRRASARYSRFDAGKAVRLGADQAALRDLHLKFRGLHERVLSDPDDKQARVDLAQTQVAYRLNNEAVYNLKRVDLVNPQSFDTYRIDAKQIAEGLRPANYQLLQARFPSADLKYMPRAQLRAADEGNETWVPTLTTRSLQLVDTTEVRRLIEQLDRKVQAGTADSRDYHTLSQAHMKLGDTRAGEAFAERAVTASRHDRKLSQDQLREANAMIKKPDG